LVTGLTSVMILVITNNCAFQSVFYQFTQSLSGTVFTYVVGVWGDFNQTRCIQSNIGFLNLRLGRRCSEAADNVSVHSCIDLDLFISISVLGLTQPHQQSAVALPSPLFTCRLFNPCLRPPQIELLAALLWHRMCGLFCTVAGSKFIHVVLAFMYWRSEMMAVCDNAAILQRKANCL